MLSRRGFTLLEVVVVLVILAVTVAIVYPSMGASLERARMDSAARELASLIKYAREKALTEQEFVGVLIHPREGTVAIQLQSGEYIRHFSLPKGVGFSRILLDGAMASDERALLWFYPDGRSTGLAIVLRHEGGRQLRLLTDILTGTTKVLGAQDREFYDAAFGQ